nr:hypothetical protein [Tanacetum cinerariifolium]
NLGLSAWVFFTPIVVTHVSIRTSDTSSKLLNSPSQAYRTLLYRITCVIPVASVHAGFPHSDISGSQSVCRLPEAFRRLPRLSSPLTAKASTVCASSLDHITPSNLVIL